MLGGGGSLGTLLLLQTAAIIQLEHVQVGDVSDRNACDAVSVSQGPSTQLESTPSEPSTHGDLEPDSGSEGESGVQQAARCAMGITKRSPSPGDRVHKPKFVVDSMMGRLMRWLRVIGVDALHRGEGEMTYSPAPLAFLR